MLNIRQLQSSLQIHEHEIIVTHPETSRSLNKRKLVLFTLFIYIGLVFTNWLPNFAFYDEGRTIFSYVNYDISPLSFVLQELRAIVMALLISVLWQQWMIYYGEVKQQFSRWEGKSSGLADISKRSHLVADMFNRWQLNSVLVVGAFFPWTFFYWQNTVALGDSRYVVAAALAMHFYWAMSWGPR